MRSRYARPARHVSTALAVVGAALLGAACDNSGRQAFDSSEIDTVENLSESLANDLLELSVAVRDGDSPEIARFFAEDLRAGPLPSRPGTLEPLERWIHRHDWTVDGDAGQAVQRERFLTGLDDLMAHFRKPEDVRFKVKGAEFNAGDRGEGKARIGLFVIARDPQGRREWLRASLRIEARKEGDAPWQIRRLEVESMESIVAATDLFSEVAFPAGVAAFFPPFGVGANAGFVSHGVAVGDINRDGLLDVATTGVEHNSLYLNRGDGRFDDISEASLVGLAPTGSGAVFLDHDNDGDVDLFMAAVGNQILLENRWVPHRELVFWDVSESALVDLPANGFSAAAADVNGDGHTDIYVASYNLYGSVMPNDWSRATNGTPNLLFINRGDGSFREQAKAWGVDDGRWSYAAAFADLDRDGDPELYVANDFGENALYRNDSDRYVEITAQAGVADPGFGMGVAFGDYDNDGDLDLHVTNMSSTAGKRILKRLVTTGPQDLHGLSKLAAGNSLYENLGDGRFRDVTPEIGGLPAGWAFGGGFIDIDNDGWEDLYSPNGFVSGKSMKDT